MTDVLASAERLCALARVGSVTIDLDVLAESAVEPALANGAALLGQLFATHGVDAIDIATTVTDAEFLKLGGIMVGPASSVSGAIVETAEALSIWNVRLHARGATLRPTPAGMRVVLPLSHDAAMYPAAFDVSAPVAQTVPPEAHTSHDEVEYTVQQAVQRGDGAAVCKLLRSIENQALFERVITEEALQLVVEQLMDQQTMYDVLLALLARAGAPGAHAVFRQLVASSETAERRFLYDVAASLPDILAVARHYTTDQTWYVVRNAAGLLGESKNQAAIPDLARLLKHADTRVRIAAVVALGQIGGPTAVARLESVLFDPSNEVRNRALSFVFAAPDADPLSDRLAFALEEESTVDFQLEVIAALSHVPTTRARNKLIDLTRERSRSLDDLQIRLAAMGALASGHRPAADPTLHALTNDAHSLIRERATALLQS